MVMSKALIHQVGSGEVRVCVWTQTKICQYRSPAINHLTDCYFADCTMISLKKCHFRNIRNEFSPQQTIHS